MSKAKHTPGPWVVRGDYYIGAAKPGMGTHAEVKSCDGVPPTPDNAEHKANARLIAAAPDLLAALRGLNRERPAYNPCFCEMAIGNPMLSSHSPECIAAWEAIKKAEGGSS